MYIQFYMYINMNLQFCNKYLIVFTIEHCFSDCHCINLNKEYIFILKKAYISIFTDHYIQIERLCYLTHAPFIPVLPSSLLTFLFSGYPLHPSSFIISSTTVYQHRQHLQRHSCKSVHSWRGNRLASVL